MRPVVIAAAVGAELLVATATLGLRASTDDHRPVGVVVDTDGSTAGAPGSPVVAVVSPRGVVLPVLGREQRGWRVRTPCGEETVVPVARPLTGATVVIDPGHGAEDIGARGPNGLTEAELNLAVAGHTRRALEAARVSVVLTRSGDYDMPLEARADLVVALKPRVFVSVHHNSGGVVRSAAPGTEAYYQMASPDSKRLAGLVYEDVSRALSTRGGPWVAARAGAKSMANARGEDYLAMLRRTQGVPSILAEMAYLNHPPEASLLARPDVQRLEGEALAAAILRYLRTNDPGSGFVDPSPPPARRGGGLAACRDPAL